MYGRAYGRTIAPCTSEAGQRNTQRYRIWASSLTKRSTVSQTLGRDDTQRGVQVSWVRRSAVWRWSESFIQDSPSGSLFTLGQLSSFFLHTWLVRGSSPRCNHNFLLRWIPLHRPMVACPHLLWGEVPSLFHPKKPSCTCAHRLIFLDLRSGHLTSLFY